MRNRTILLVMTVVSIACAIERTPEDDASLNAVADRAYKGALKDAQLENEVRLIDTESILTIEFFQKSPLLAQVTFKGELEIFYLTLWWKVEGPLEETVKNLNVQNGELSGKIEVEGVTLTFDGVFSTDQTLLHLLVDKLGSLTLVEIEPGTPIIILKKQDIDDHAP